MRISSYIVLCALGALSFQACAQTPLLTTLAVRTRADVADLQCEPRAAVPRPPKAPDVDPMEIPTEAMLESVPAPTPLDAAVDGQRLPALAASGGMRIAIWGDSHLAANFFTEHLSKLLKYPVDGVSDLIVPANMGKGGVRLPLRKSCVSAQWKYEPGYVSADNAVAPGPGLMNMSTNQPGASLAWDLRTAPAARGYEKVRLLYQQGEAPIKVAVSVDGGEEQEVLLDGAAGPGILELQAEQPIVQVRLRLLDGALRFHGLELLSPRANGWALDVFGYPGATVAAWKTAQLPYLKSWFGRRDYQLVALEFGTNEGNVKPFDAAVYRRLLLESVANFRGIFPTTACVLISPGDRGVLVRRSANLRKKGGGKKKSTSRVDLFEYARIHAAIGRLQAEVAAQAGCQVWSMQHAMGGPGSAYRWARQSPALMAPDLIHFTVAGYQRLAQQFAKDMGWIAP